jgi:protein-S-isoprenylcysteine O-methyltransferase Ste14
MHNWSRKNGVIIMDIRKFFFQYRGFTPVPLVLIVLIFAQPNLHSFLWGLFWMLLGELIRIWGVAYAGGATRTRQVGAPYLVTDGPFGYVRNPLYIGNIIMYTGATLMANVWIPWLIFIVWVFFSIQYYFIIDLEEEKLSELFGKEYLIYKEKVPKFIPSLSLQIPKEKTIPDYKKAFISEKSTFISFITIILLILGKWLINQNIL